MFHSNQLNDRKKRKRNRSQMANGRKESDEPFTIKLEIDGETASTQTILHEDDTTKTAKLNAIREVLEDLVVTKREERIFAFVSEGVQNYSQSFREEAQNMASGFFMETMKELFKGQFESYVSAVKYYDDQVKESQMLLMNGS